MIYPSQKINSTNTTILSFCVEFIIKLTWLKLAHIDDWKTWASHVLGAEQPSLGVDVDEDLASLRNWIFSRIWPQWYPELEDAFENFRQVLQDFQNTFHKYSEKGPVTFCTKKIYHINEWDKEKYEKLYKKYIFHVELVEDLILELTRAANYICDKARQFIYSTFRLEEGILIVVSGPYMNMFWHSHRVQYRGDERIRIPYTGLEQFKKDRVGRDFNFGVGVSTDDPEFLKWYHLKE